MIHAPARGIDTQASEDHAAAHGGWNKMVDTSTKSWEAEENGGVACLSKRSTDGNRSDFENARFEIH